MEVLEELVFTVIQEKVEERYNAKSEIRFIILYFLLAFGITWGLYIPTFNLHLVNSLVAVPGLYGPAFAAIIVTFLTSRGRGVRQLLGRYKIWRFKLRWYGVAFLLMPFAIILAAFLGSGSSYSSQLSGISLPLIAAYFFVFMLVNSGEEIGWRGFALPKLEKLSGSSLVASLVLGFVWGLWHIPVFLAGQEGTFPFPLFVLFTMGLSITFTTLMNSTFGSLLSVTILHASVDTMNAVFKISVIPVGVWVDLVLLTWISAMALFFVKGYFEKLNLRNFAKWKV